jgi:uncharacterized Ntn-hydrolase superfamily protein
MRKRVFTAIGIVFTTMSHYVFAQDTFSIVAVDSITGEVGSAGASCIDLFNFPALETDFLGELFPGVGAINTQSFYNTLNQQNARVRMFAGDTPQQIINYLITNDAENTPETRQYGIAAIVNGKPQTAAFTGAGCFDYKNHILGRNYAIQGNILSGQHVLDSMEARFLRAEGDLACKLMAALQGANEVGADTRCAQYGTSSLFAFLKVAVPTDTFIQPSFRISVKFSASAASEPVDSLQKVFNASRMCFPTSVNTIQPNDLAVSFYPNPVTDKVYFKSTANPSQAVQVVIYNLSGQRVAGYQQPLSQPVNLSELDEGMYIIELEIEGNIYRNRIIKTIKL